MVHILGGHLRNRILKTEKRGVRPTTSLIRKAVFDILHTSIENATFLDLCAGTGAMGIEALSRGAHHTTFIDQSVHAARTIRENLTSLDLSAQAEVLMGSALEMLKKLHLRGKSFDIIYCDPPYQASTLFPKILSLFETCPLLNKGGTLFFEEGFPSLFSPSPLIHLAYRGSRRYGSSLLHILN